MPPRQIFRHNYQRQNRLAIHLGIAAVKRQSKRRLGKVFWAASASAVVALLVLSSVLFLSANNPNSSAKQPVRTVEQPTSVETTTPEPVATAPVTTTPEPTPVPQPVVKPTPKPAKPAFTTSIAIDGDAACQSDTLAALELISTKAPAHYATVTKYIGVIKCVAQGSGMEAYLSPPRYLVGDSTRNAGTLWYAGTIVHDSGHSKLYNDYLSAHPGQSVPGEIWTGQSAEATCLNSQYDALQQMDAPQATLDYIQNVINTEYWNIPYDQRWW